MEKENKYSNKELTDRQKKYIKNLYSNTNKEAKGTIKIIRKIKSKFRYTEYEQITYIDRNKLLKVIMGISIITIAYLYIISSVNNSNKYNIPVSSDSSSNINIYMNNENELEYSITKLSCKTGNSFININTFSWLYEDLDTDTDKYKIGDKNINISKDLNIKAFDIQTNYSYLEYSNEENTGNKELIICEKTPESIDTKIFQRNGVRFKEKSNPTQIKSVANSHENMFIMLVETIGGGKLNISSLKDKILDMEGYMTKSNDSSGINININGLGNLKLDNIDEVKSSPQVTYNRDTDIIQIRNKAEDITYLSISKINNANFGCNAEDLIATNIDNLFITLDFDKEDSAGYKTFALIGGDNLYCFRLNKLSHISLMDNLLKQLGIENKPLEVKVIQRVINK